MNTARTMAALIVLTLLAYTPNALASTVTVGSTTYLSPNSALDYSFISKSSGSMDWGIDQVNIVDYILSNKLGEYDWVTDTYSDSNSYKLLDVGTFQGLWYGDVVSAVLIDEIAGYKDTNAFGYYTLDANGAVVKPSDSIVFPGSANYGATTSFKLSKDQSLGFYLGVASTGSTYYTQSTQNSGQEIYAAIFQVNDSNRYIIGFEDLPLRSSDRDYQDMIVSVTVSTPEPATLLLLSIGGAGAALMSRRRARDRR